MQRLEAALAKVRSDEGALRKETEEYQTHLEEELAESQAQRAALLEEGESNAARTEVPDHSSCPHFLLPVLCTMTGAGLSDSAEGWR